MGLLSVHGRYSNLLARASLSSSPAAHATYGLAKLYDEVPGRPFTWTSYNASSRVDGDFNQITNSTFDTDLTGWEDCDSGGGASSRTTVGAEVYAGAGALKLDATAGVASRVPNSVTVPSGSYWQLDFWSRGDAGSGRAKVRVYCVETGQYYNGTAWAATQAAATQGGTSATYAQTTLALQAPPWSTTRSDTVTLMFDAYSDGGIAYVDDFTFYPGVNIVAVAGHTIDPRVTFMLRRSTDAFAADDTLVLSTTSCLQPSFFLYDSATVHYYRWWRVRLNWGGTVPSGTLTLSAAYLGEVILGQAVAMSAGLLADGQTTESMLAQVRSASPGGAELVTAINTRSHRRVSLPLFARTEAEWASITELWERSDYGARPVLVVPDSAEGTCHYGRLRSSLPASRVGPWIAGTPRMRAVLQLDELPGLAVGL